MHRTPSLLVVLALALGLGACPVPAQGVGTPGGGGLVPRVDFEHRAVGVPNTLTLYGFPAYAPVSLAVSLAPSGQPLAFLGLGPAVLGPDVQAPLGGLLHGFVADADGAVHLPLALPLDATAIVLHVQAIGVDPTAPHGGFAVSEHRRFRFGFEREALPFALGDGTGAYDLIEAFGYGAAAAPTDPELQQVTFADLLLVNENELLAGRSDRPVLDPFLPGVRRLLLPDGTAILGVQRAPNVDGLVMVRPDGRIEPLIMAPSAGGDPGIEHLVAASAFAPWIAFASENGIAAFGGARLFLARVDGWNAPGTAAKVVALPSPPNLEIEACSLCFLDGALFFGDGESELWRHDLATGVQTRVALVDAAGAHLPYVDEECAPAADGSALALGAGASENLHDVWVVHADGTAFNLTGLPADYEDAGPGELDGMQLAMSPTGDTVAYMRTVVENEAFARGTAPGAPERHLTHAGSFVDSIDTVIGVGWRANGSIAFAGGQSPTSVDLYRGDPVAPGPVPIENVTASSGFTAPIFDVGATLQLVTRFTTPEHLVSALSDASGSRLVFIDQGGAQLELPLGSDFAVGARVQGLLVSDQDATGRLRLRLVPDVAAATAQPVFTSALPVIPVGRARDVGGVIDAFLVMTTTGAALVHVDAQGVATQHPGPQRAPTGELHVDGEGRVVALTQDAATQQSFVERFDPATQTWTTTLGPIGASSLGVFLR